MSKPTFILVRHGESEGNVNPEIYSRVPDHKIDLTPEGESQAKKSRFRLDELVPKYPRRVYSSPYLRAYRTGQIMCPSDAESIRQDPRIREQEWGNLQTSSDIALYKEQRKIVGHFFYRFPHGESGADVYDRCSMFLETVFRDVEKDNFINPAPVIVFTHGLTMRVLAMRLTHASVDEFESWDNPPNCHITVITRDEYKGYVISEGAFEKWK